MNFNFMFFFNSILLGIGLAMDAFSVSMADGLSDTKIKTGKIFIIAGIFAFFQALMPLTGWFFVHSFVNLFSAFNKFIPWIALFLLSYIGGKMLYDGIINDEEENISNLTPIALLVQGVATSIDALSVGFTISDYTFLEAFIASLMIALVTFIICFAGVIIGKTVGNRLQNKATILGGTILIVIGIEIFVSGVFF